MKDLNVLGDSRLKNIEKFIYIEIFLKTIKMNYYIQSRGYLNLKMTDQFQKRTISNISRS